MYTPPFGISLDTVRTYLGVEAIGSPNTTPRDLVYLALLNAALANLKRITGRNLVYGVYRDTFQQLETKLYLRENVEQLISVKASDQLVAEDQYRFFKSKGLLYFDNGWYANWRGYSRFGVRSSAFAEVTYVGGYTTLPPDMLMAVLSGVQAADNYLQQHNTYGGLVKRISVIDVGVTDIAVPTVVSTNVMQDTMSSQLIGYSIQDNPGFAGWKLAESEYLGTYGGSPDLVPFPSPVFVG